MSQPLSLPHFHSGKVRDTYKIRDHPDVLLMVASDRISTHNVLHRSLVPGKGELLTALTVFWTLDVLAGFENHLVEYGRRMYDLLPPEVEYPPDFHRRALLVRLMRPEPREFVWRNYLTGSLWELYRQGKDPYELRLPAGLAKMHRFAKPLFTPTRKSESDEPVRARLGKRQYPASAAATGEAFARMAAYLDGRGITLVDAKFEAAGSMLIDEWGTGDCCRFARTRDMKEGMDPPWLDKEVFRQEAMRAWNGGPKVPLDFDPLAVERGVRRYHEAFEEITDCTLSEFQARYLD